MEGFCPGFLPFNSFLETESPDPRRPHFLVDMSRIPTTYAAPGAARVPGVPGVTGIRTTDKEVFVFCFNGNGWGENYYYC